MSFLYPSFLWALSALAVPVIVHLFNFRRYKKVYFTNVRFLKEVQQESRSKSTLKRLLILLSRLLLLGCAILAFAQPYIPDILSNSAGNKNSMQVYIDNSFSMQAAAKNGIILEEARNKARYLLQSLPVSSRIQLLTNDFNTSPQTLLSKEQALDVLDKISISPSVKTLEEVYKRLATEGSAEMEGASVFLFSDFQKNTFGNFIPDTLRKTSLVYIENIPPQNLCLDTCYMENPYFQKGSQQTLHVKIKNYSDKEIDNGSLKLYINNKQIAPASFKLNPKNATEVQINITCKDTGLQQAMLALEDYPVTFDDTLYFSYRVNSKIPCLAIGPEDEKSMQFIQSLFESDSSFTFYRQNDKQIDYAYFGKSNLVIIDGLQAVSSGLTTELKKYIQSGGSVLFFPSAKPDNTLYADFLRELQVPAFMKGDTGSLRVESKGISQTLYEGVFEKIPGNMDMPLVRFHYSSASNTKSGEEVLLKYINNQSFLSVYPRGKGKLYICSAPLDDAYSSFARHALFVPTLIKIAVLSKPAPPLYYHAGKNEAIDVSGIVFSNDNPLHIKSYVNSTDFIPEVKNSENSRYLFTQGFPIYAGNYYLFDHKVALENLSFNYDRSESDLTCFTREELKEYLLKQNNKYVSLVDADTLRAGFSVSDIQGGTKLWKLFIVLALVFLAIETLIIRFVK